MSSCDTVLQIVKDILQDFEVTHQLSTDIHHYSFSYEKYFSCASAKAQSCEWPALRSDDNLKKSA